VLWRKSQALGLQPSEALGLTRGSYEAYCLDEAVWYLGTTIEAELNEAENGKPSKGQRKAEDARKRVLEKHFGKTPEAKRKFADPMAFFSD
jgi:hypothetical protein